MEIGKFAKIGAAAALLYFGPTYIMSSYLKNKDEGEKFPLAATIEDVAEDTGKAVKESGKYAAKAVKAGAKNGYELVYLIKKFSDEDPAAKAGEEEDAGMQNSDKKQR